MGKEGIHIPDLYFSDLNENSTRYDRLAASPSEDELELMWLLWSIITSIVTAFCAIVFIAILVNKKVRSVTFNKYLIYLMVPDCFFNFMCFVNCTVNYINGAYASENWCKFQSFYIIFGIGANSWVNAIVAYELHKMLRFSHRRRRYHPPSNKTVTIQSLICYVWAALVACIPVYIDTGLPVQSQLVNGFCVPAEYNKTSTIFFFTVYLPAFALIPLFYLIYVAYDIVSRGLLPRNGKTRSLAMYFFRLIVVFIIMWLPTLLLMFVLISWAHRWTVFVGGAWSHFQAAVSAGVSLLKPDIYDAVISLVTCRPSGTQKTRREEQSADQFVAETQSSKYASNEGSNSDVECGVRAQHFGVRDSSSDATERDTVTRSFTVRLLTVASCFQRSSFTSNILAQALSAAYEDLSDPSSALVERVTQELESLKADGDVEEVAPNLFIVTDSFVAPSLPVEERAEMQLAMGRHLRTWMALQDDSGLLDTSGHTIFLVVDLLNRASDLISDHWEHIDLVELNIEAAQKAIDLKMNQRSIVYLRKAYAMNKCDECEETRQRIVAYFRVLLAVDPLVVSTDDMKMTGLYVDS